MQPEFLNKNNGILAVQDTSDLSKSFEELNDDTLNKEGFTSIDTRTRLTAAQIPALAGLDFLCNSGVYPKSLNRIGRSVKRLAVSVRGGGRKDMVSVARGVSETEAMAGKSIVERSKE